MYLAEERKCQQQGVHFSSSWHVTPWQALSVDMMQVMLMDYIMAQCAVKLKNV